MADRLCPEAAVGPRQQRVEDHAQQGGVPLAQGLLELLREAGSQLLIRLALLGAHRHVPELLLIRRQDTADVSQLQEAGVRSEEQTSELQSLMSYSHDVF